MTLVLAAVALVLVLGIAVMTARGGGSGPRGGVTWGPLDASGIEDRIREGLGGGPEDPDPELLHLARYHAFDMASRDFDGPVNPEGEDLATRRARIAPTYVGTARQSQQLFRRDAGTREAEIAKKALAAMGDVGPEAVVGVAVEGGRVAVVVVEGRRVATLDAAPMTDLVAGDFEQEGHMVPGLPPDGLTAIWEHDGADVPAGPTAFKGEDLPDDPEEVALPFVLEVPVPEGESHLVLRLEHAGTPVYRATIRGG